MKDLAALCVVLIGTVLVLGLSALGGEPQAEKPIPLAPEYACSGVLDGKSYALVLTLKPFGDGYALSWVADRQELFAGFGIRHGNHLAVISQDKRANTVLAAYLIEPGTLNGRWMAGDGEMQTELCLVGKPA